MNPILLFNLLIDFWIEMEYPSFPSLNFNETKRGCNPLIGYEYEELIAKSNQVPTFEIAGCGGIDNFCSDYVVHPQNIHVQRASLFEDGHKNSSNYWVQNNLHHNYEAAKEGKIQTPISELSEIITENTYAISTSSMKLLRKYGRVGKSRDDYVNKLSNYTKVGCQKLSTEEIMRVAGERYIELSTRMVNGLSVFIHPYGSSLSSLSIEETRDVELAHRLLEAAEKVGFKQFDMASRLLACCAETASDKGNPVQRTIFYFVEALRCKIGRELGTIKITREDEQIRYANSLSSGTNLAFLACHQLLPFTQVMQFAGMQVIIDNVATATKIHLIDLNIRSGIQWTALMQALSERDNHPVELLRITALGTTDKEKIEETGKRLLSFAESMNLPFDFNIVFLSDMKDIKEELFNIEIGEAAVVYCPTILRMMISRPDCLENLMSVISGLNPSIMVVTEVEANHNSPVFVNRFIEALFFYGAFFDCLEDCMDRENEFRMTIEGIYFRGGIQNMVAAEGEERITRSVKINVWRAFFQRFRMVEIEFSESALYQADLVLKQFSCGSSCTLGTNGKSLIVEWKGTPIHSLSAWKFT